MQYWLDLIAQQRASFCIASDRACNYLTKSINHVSLLALADNVIYLSLKLGTVKPFNLTETRTLNT